MRSYNTSGIENCLNTFKLVTIFILYLIDITGSLLIVLTYQLIGIILSGCGVLVIICSVILLALRCFEKVNNEFNKLSYIAYPIYSIKILILVIIIIVSFYYDQCILWILFGINCLLSIISYLLYFWFFDICDLPDCLKIN